VKAIKCNGFEQHGQSGVASRLHGPEGKDNPVVTRLVPGTAMSAVIQETTQIVGLILPSHALHVFSDMEGFYGAYHPDPKYLWINKWRQDRFRKKPPANNAEWRVLDKTTTDRDVEITAGPPDEEDCTSWSILDEVTAAASAIANPRPQGEPVDERWSAADEKAALDALHRHALSKGP